MANIKKTIDIQVNTNSKEVQNEFETLRASIAETEKEIDKLAKQYGENSKEADAARKNLAQLGLAYDKLSQNAVDLGASFEDVNGDIKPLTASLGELEDRLYALALAGEQNGAEFAALTEEAGRYRQAQIQTDLAVDSAAKTTAQKLGGALTAAAGGFAIAQGAAGLFGTESEKVEKAMLKVQQSLALVQGITAFRENINDVKGLGKDILKLIPGLGAFGTTAAVTATEVAAIGTAGAVAGTEVAVGMEAATVGTYSFAGALTATGIGAIIVGIGVAIAVIAAYWDDITEAVSGVSAAQKDGLKLAQENTVAQQEALDAISDSEETLKAQGKSESEILELKKEQTQEVYDATLLEKQKNQDMRKSQIEAAERNKSILQGIIRFLTLPLTIILGTVDAITNAISKIPGIDIATNLEEGFSGGLANLIFDPESIKKEGEAADKEADKSLSKLKNTVDGYSNQQKEKAKKDAEEAAKEAKELNDKIVAEQKKHNEEMVRLKKENADTLAKIDELNANTDLEKEKVRYANLERTTKEAYEKELASLSGTGKELEEAKTALQLKYQNLRSLQYLENQDKVDAIEANTKRAQAKLLSEIDGQTYEEALAQLNLANETERDALIKAGLDKVEIAKLFAQRVAKLTAEQSGEQKSTAVDRKYFQDVAKLYNDDTLNAEKRADKLKKLDQERAAEQLRIQKETNIELMKLAGEGTKEYEALAKKNEEIDAQSAKNKIEIAKQEADEKIGQAERFADIALEIATSLADLAQALLEVQTKKINEEYDKRLNDQKKNSDARLNNLELSDAQRAEIERQSALQSAAIEEEKAAKLKEVQKKQANIDLAITIANITASTALAIAKAVAASPLTGGLPFSAIAGVLGAAQLGTAIAQRKAIQGLARGGMIYGSGGPTQDNIPIMASSGEAVINAAAVKKFAPILSAINQSTGGAPIQSFAAGGVVTANPGEVSITNINDLAAVTGQGAVRAYLLDSEVTSASARNARIRRQSILK